MKDPDAIVALASIAAAIALFIILAMTVGIPT